MLDKLKQQLVTLPVHGGDLASASRIFQIPEQDWVDLSTGINPNSYPVPDIPASVFSRLSYLSHEFLEAARDYYQVDDLLPVPGSQSAIQLLPALLNSEKNLPVLLPNIGYQEHYFQWKKQGAELFFYQAMDGLKMVDEINLQIKVNPSQHLVIINPNNPTGVQIGAQQILQWAQELGSGAYVIVDEAFIDAEPKGSALNENMLPDNLIVLRSFGKFFGLAGIRLGFVMAAQSVLSQINCSFGLWQITGPTQFIATQALSDTQWQNKTRDNLHLVQRVMLEVFQRHKHLSLRSNPLFLSLQMPLQKALDVYLGLAQQGVLTRLVPVSENEALLRVGLTDGSVLGLIDEALG